MSEWVKALRIFSSNPIHKLDLGAICCEIETVGREDYQVFIYSAESIYMYSTSETLKQAKDRAEKEVCKRLNSALKLLAGLEA